MLGHRYVQWRTYVVHLAFAERLFADLIPYTEKLHKVRLNKTKKQE
jgi:hypothetical protein